MIGPSFFSGISLLLHLGIISFVELLGLVGISDSHQRRERSVTIIGVPRIWFQYALSIAVFIIIITIVFSFTAIAIVTGYQLGEGEPQRVFAKAVITQLVSDIKGSVNYLEAAFFADNGEVESSLPRSLAIEQF